MFSIINNLFSPKPDDHPQEDGSDRNEHNSNNATNEEVEKEELMDVDFPTNQPSNKEDNGLHGARVSQEPEENENNSADDTEDLDVGSIENADANHQTSDVSEQNKLEILSNWRINKLQARLKQLGVSFKPKDNNKKLAKLILEHDPEIDLGTNTQGEGSVAARSPERRKKDDSAHRYELRSASKKRRSSSILPSSAKKDKSDAAEFYYPPVTRTSAAHRRKSHKKSPGKSPMTSPLQSQASQPSTTISSRRSSRRSESSVPATIATTASTTSRRGRRKKQVVEEESVQEEQSIRSQMDSDNEQENESLADHAQQNNVEPAKTNLLYHFEINNSLTHGMPLTEGFEKFDPETVAQQATQPFHFHPPEPEIQNEFEIALEPAQEILSAAELAHPVGGEEAVAMEEIIEERPLDSQTVPEPATEENEVPMDEELHQSDLNEVREEIALNNNVQAEEEQNNVEEDSSEESIESADRQFKTPMQAGREFFLGFTGNSGRGKPAEVSEAEEQSEMEDDDDESGEYYETNTIESVGDEDNRQVVDLMDSSESEQEEQEEEIDAAEENDDESVAIEEDASEEALEKDVTKPFSDAHKNDEEDNASLPDLIKSNPEASLAMNVLTKIGSNFVIAFTNDQGSKLPSLSEQEYDLFKTMLEKLKPAGVSDPAPVAPSQSAPSSAPQKDAETEMEVEEPREISIQTEEPLAEEEKPSVNPPVKQVMFKEPDIFAKTNLSRKVKWDLPEESSSVQSPPASIDYARTPQFLRQNPTPHRLPTPYYQGAFFSSGSEGTVSSSAKKRTRDDDSEPDPEDDDRARKRISFGGDNQKPSLEINTALATSDSFSPPDQQAQTLTPAASTAMNPFQSNLKFNLTQSNFLNSGAYIPKFRSGTVQLGGNQRNDIVGRGLSFLEKRKLSNSSIPAPTNNPAASAKVSHSNPASGVVAKEILKALSDITTPVEEFRKQPIPRLYPNDIFNGAPKPNIFESKNNTFPALPAPPSTSNKEAQPAQSSNKNDGKSVSFSTSTKPAEVSTPAAPAPFTFSFNNSSVPPPSIDTGKKSAPATTGGLSFPKPQESLSQQAASSTLFTSAAPPKNSFAFDSNKPKEASSVSVTSTTVKQDGEFTFGDPMDLGDETVPVQSAADPAIKYMFSPPSKNRKRKSEVPSSSSKEPVPSSSSSGNEKEREEKKAKPSVDIWSKTEVNKGLKCPVCMVRNDEKAIKCVSCESVLKPDAKAAAPVPAPLPKPAPSTSSAAPTADIWAKFTSTDDIKCPVCMVRNKKDAVKCVSCESALTSSSGASSQPKASVPATTSGAITTGGFTFGAPPADSSKPAFQFGAPAVAPIPAADSKPAAGGFSFEFGKSADASKSSSLPDLKPIVTSGSGFLFGASDKAPSLAGTSSSPALIPNLPFTPLPVNSSKKSFSPREDDNQEDEDRAKRAKRKVEEPSSFSSNPVDDKKLSFAFGAGKSLDTTTTTTALKETGGFTFGSAAPATTVPAVPAAGFQFSAGTSTAKSTSTFGNDKPAFGADTSAPKSLQFGAPASSTIPSNDKDKDTKKESLPATTFPKSEFTFGAATNNNSQSLPTTTKSAPFEFGKSASEATEKKDNATELKAFGSAAFSSAPIPAPSASAPFGAGAAFTFSAGSTKTEKAEEKKPAAAAASSPFVFGASKPAELTASVNAFDTKQAVSFSLGTNDSNKPVAISFGTTKKEEPKPPLPPGPPPSSAAPFQFGAATTGGKITPPPATPFGSSGNNNNNSHMMESPNPTEPSALNAPAAASAPFTFGAPPPLSVPAAAPNAAVTSNPFTFSAGTTTTTNPLIPPATTSAPLFPATPASNNTAIPSIPLFGNSAPSVGGNPFSTGGAPVAPFGGQAAGAPKGPFGAPLGGNAAPAFPPAPTAAPFQAGGTPLFGVAPAGPGANIFGGASNPPAGPFGAANSNPFGGGPSAFPPIPGGGPPASAGSAPFTFNAGGAQPPAPFMGGGGNTAPVVFGAGMGGGMGGGSSNGNLAAMGGPAVNNNAGGGGGGGFNIGASDQRKKYKVVKRNSSSQQ